MHLDLRVNITTVNSASWATISDSRPVAPPLLAISSVFGGRIGFNVRPNIALEGEMAYDFERNYTTINGSGGTTTTVTSGLRPLTGLFGPKFQFGTSGPFRAFVTGKVGFTDFTVSSRAASGSSFAGSFDTFGNGGTHVAVYPGGGIEAFGGPFGVRIEAGDEMYFNNGTRNNLRVTFAPTIRF